MSGNFQPYFIELNSSGCLNYIDGYMPYNIYNEYGVYINEEQFKKIYSRMDGQITRENQLGKHIFMLASDPDGPKTWLDIGTWNGRGTTTCILDGFQASGVASLKKCVSLELHPFMYNVASENLKEHPAISSVEFIKGTLGDMGAVKHILLPTNESIPDDVHYRMYYETDMALWNAALLNQIELPFKPEAVVLDGGEYTGYVDWLYTPKENLKYVFLDDSAVLKNKRVRMELLQSSEWKLVEESMTDRNGWSFFMRN